MMRRTAWRLSVLRSFVAASSASAVPSVKSEAELARAAGAMVSPEEVAAGGVAAETASPAVKADAVEGSSGPAVSRDAAKRVKGKRVVTRHGGPQNRFKVVRKKIMKRDKEINKAVTFVAHLKVLRETLTGRDPRRPTFQEYTAARNALRKSCRRGRPGIGSFIKWWAKRALLVMSVMKAERKWCVLTRR